MKTMTVVYRIIPKTAPPESYAHLITPSNVGTPQAVEYSTFTDAEGNAYLLEATYLKEKYYPSNVDVHSALAKHCESIPGLVRVEDHPEIFTSDASKNDLNQNAQAKANISRKDKNLLTLSIPTRMSYGAPANSAHSSASAVAPTVIPTVAPTVIPTVIPTVAPTVIPTVAPTVIPHASASMSEEAQTNPNWKVTDIIIAKAYTVPNNQSPSVSDGNRLQLLPRSNLPAPRIHSPSSRIIMTPPLARPRYIIQNPRQVYSSYSSRISRPLNIKQPFSPNITYRKK